MTTAFKVKGQKELAAFFNAMPDKLRKGAARSGVSAAAAVIRDEARLRAPKKTGKMAKSIKSGSSRVNRDGAVSVRIRLDGPHAFLGLMHEYGVSPHFIAAKDAAVSLRTINRSVKRGADQKAYGEGVLKIGDNYISGGVMHPGHAARPFMRPALDAKRGEALQAFGDKIQDYLKGRTGLTAPSIDVEE